MIFLLFAFLLWLVPFVMTFIIAFTGAFFTLKLIFGAVKLIDKKLK